MCLSPVKIVAKDKYIQSSYRQPIHRLVPCGCCDECQNTKSLSYAFRLQEEFKSTISQGHFVYYDTLTYSDEFLPHVSDFFTVPNELDLSCFNRSHFRHFLVRLRRRLSYYGYENADSLRYFLTSEYGSKLHTWRPHYHILFFVRFPIDPLEFSKLVSDCWIYGRTDGYPYKSPLYVDKHNVIRDENFKVSSYVSKYVRKSNAYSDRISKVENYLMNECEDIDFCDRFSLSSYKRLVKRILHQFFLVSHFVGLDYLDTRSVDSFIQYPKATLFSKRQLLEIPLPRYYKNHLFKSCYKDYNGVRHYDYNEDGLRYKSILDSRLMSSTIQNFQCYLTTIGSLVSPCQLADYYLNKRYTNNLLKPVEYQHITKRFSSADLFLFASDHDFDQFGNWFITSNDCGSYPNYKSSPNVVCNLHDWLCQSYENEDFEKLLVGYERFRREKSVLLDSLNKRNEYIVNQFA